MRKAPTLQELRELTNKLPPPKEKQRIMELLTWDKFMRHKPLKEKLDAISGRDLSYNLDEPFEENLYWGVVDGKGKNAPGQSLTKIRKAEWNQYLEASFDLITNKKLLPTISFEVVKDGKVLETIVIEGRRKHIFGSHP